MLWFVCDPHDKASQNKSVAPPPCHRCELTVSWQGTSEIWSPDVTLWNAAQDPEATLVRRELTL